MTRKATGWLVAGLLAGLAAGPVRAADVPAQAGYAEIATRLEALVAEQMADKKLPAVSIALVDDQRVVWARGFGYADPAAKRPATADSGLPRGLGVEALHRHRGDAPRGGRQARHRRAGHALPAGLPARRTRFPAASPSPCACSCRTAPASSASRRWATTSRPTSPPWPLPSRASTTRPSPIRRSRRSSTATPESPPWATSSRSRRRSRSRRGSRRRCSLPLGMTRSSFEKKPELREDLAEGHHVDARRTDLRRSRLPLRHGPLRGHVLHGARPLALPERALRPRPHPRGSCSS